jgi:Protein of unknown function (DUF1552)
MIVTKRQLARRTFLRGMGVTLALPLLDSMIPAFATAKLLAATRARRFGVVYIPNGLYMPMWTPQAVGTGYEATRILESLAAVREHFVVVSGLTHKPAISLPGEGAGDHVRA